ncbi:hypothetical protein UB23_12980 [Pseudomonas sp. ES3-33]|nr:hypothetical protein UB23_12980 [Pseudomonas sp. ES3-33]
MFFSFSRRWQGPGESLNALRPAALCHKDHGVKEVIILKIQRGHPGSCWMFFRLIHRLMDPVFMQRAVAV